MPSSIVILPTYTPNIPFLQTLTKMRYYCISKVFVISFSILPFWTLRIFITYFSKVVFYFLIFKKLKIYKGPTHTLSHISLFFLYLHLSIKLCLWCLVSCSVLFFWSNIFTSSFYYCLCRDVQKGLLQDYIKNINPFSFSLISAFKF